MADKGLRELGLDHLETAAFDFTVKHPAFSFTKSP
jgi:hypothetical protein